MLIVCIGVEGKVGWRRISRQHHDARSADLIRETAALHWQSDYDFGNADRLGRQYGRSQDDPLIVRHPG